ncbi:MAG: InlB B-repeat-containing protein [Clostridia bacterium]|nr:InlB B-repeat-containing protein [Clostridia bacterium]
MKTSKKLLSILLSVLLVVLTVSCLAVCFTASAEYSYHYIHFGTYPQTRVNETTALKNAANNATWKSYDYYIGYGSTNDPRVDGTMMVGRYMQFADFFLNGVKYRAVKFNYYRPYATNWGPVASRSYQDDNGYVTDTTYYFEYEPLTWRVVDNGGTRCYAICESIIDAQAYQNVVREESGNYYIGTSSVYANHYDRSSIHAWLNEDFLNTAFTAAQQRKIHSMIYLLTRSEAANDYYVPTSSRRVTGTDYAECQGLKVESDGYSNWILRDDAHSSGQYVYGVSNGSIAANSFLVYSTSNGIRPHCILEADTTSDTTVNPGLYSAGNKIRTVNVTVNPAAGGTVTGAGDYGVGASVTVKATPKTGYKFDGWYQGGTRLSTNKSYTFTVPDGTSSLNYTAKFTTAYTVTVIADPAAGGTVTSSITYTNDLTWAHVVATPNSGYHFVGWYEGNTKFNDGEDWQFVLKKDITLKAKFEKNDAVNYEVITPVSEGGTVTGGGTYHYHELVILTATPNSGYHFVGWYEGNTKVEDSEVYKFGATENVTVTAKFEKDASTDPGTPDPGTPDPGTPESVCPWCGGQHNGFFQGIIGFFHGIFAKLFGARY